MADSRSHSSLAPEIAKSLASAYDDICLGILHGSIPSAVLEALLLAGIHIFQVELQSEAAYCSTKKLLLELACIVRQIRSILESIGMRCVLRHACQRPRIHLQENECMFTSSLRECGYTLSQGTRARQDDLGDRQPSLITSSAGTSHIQRRYRDEGKLVAY
ncbi:hypothetical protein DENSPDRAFT_500261 [Dentipellis sp. KUC8613]|nr:hypothetical protein DENSPDRAFT_500261 [Dentipellis sp. KUC8613]